MRVLHLLSTNQRRGAETFASDLIASTNGNLVHQRVLVIGPLQSAAVRFDAPVASLGANGSGIPLIRVAPQAVWALRNHLRAWRPDIVQAHGSDTLKYAVLATVGSRTPIVYRSIGVAPRWIHSGPRKVLSGFLMRGSARIVAVADAVRRELIDVFGLSEARVITIPNGVDARRVQPTRDRAETRRMLGIPQDDRVLLSLGALSWEKDPLAHLAVSSRIMKCRSAVTHLMVGDGPMRAQIERDIGRMGLKGRVLMAGSRSDVADLLSAADILLFASRADGMEGMPATIIEAGMLGRPVAGYAVAGVPEVVVHGRTGLLVAPGDIDGLSDCALRLIDDEAERRDLGTAATERCRARYEISTIANRYLKLYEEVAGVR
jgi:glycosyltransferase involved in cell wall biosynthesis